MSHHLQRVFRLLEQLAENQSESVTVECPCPTWSEWSTILAAASLTASNIPNAKTVSRVLAVLSALIARIARDQVDHHSAD